MPEVFLDTDVVFAIISKRESHYGSSVQLLELAAQHKIRLVISEICLANLIHLSFDIYKLKDASAKLVDLISACEVVAGGKDSALSALRSTFRDEEDALQYYTALRAGADFFITRNLKDYRPAQVSLPVYSPADFLNQLQ